LLPLLTAPYSTAIAESCCHCCASSSPHPIPSYSNFVHAFSNHFLTNRFRVAIVWCLWCKLFSYTDDTKNGNFWKTQQKL